MNSVLNGVQKKSKVLGKAYSVARYQLTKMVLFKLLKELKQDICYRCGKQIEKIEELTLDHKKGWVNSDKPIELFYDLDNISFSHHSCNCGATTPSKTHPGSQGENNTLCKLTDIQVDQIRNSSDRITCRELAKQYNVSHVTILDIKNLKRRINNTPFYQTL